MSVIRTSCSHLDFCDLAIIPDLLFFSNVSECEITFRKCGMEKHFGNDVRSLGKPKQLEIE